MSTRRLEEILEECLSAYLDGRRSVEESLSLYPSHASDLGPLLRTATSINSTLNAYNPPPHVQQRGLHRFLSDARARQNLKSLKVSGSQRGRLSVIWQKYRLGFAGAGMAVLILAASVGGATIMDTSGSGNQVTDPRTDSATPAVVIALQEKVNIIRSKAANQVTPDDLRELRAAVAELQNTSQEDIEPARDSIEQALNDANALVSEIIQTSQDPDLVQPAQETSDQVRDVAGGLGLTLSPTPTVVVTTPPEDTPTTAPTAEPTPEPTAPPTAEPTPAPTEDPMATPEPTEQPPRVPAVIE